MTKYRRVKNESHTSHVRETSQQNKKISKLKLLWYKNKKKCCFFFMYLCRKPCTKHSFMLPRDKTVRCHYFVVIYCWSDVVYSRRVWQQLTRKCLRIDPPAYLSDGRKNDRFPIYLQEMRGNIWRRKCRAWKFTWSITMLANHSLLHPSSSVKNNPSLPIVQTHYDTHTKRHATNHTPGKGKKRLVLVEIPRIHQHALHRTRRLKPHGRPQHVQKVRVHVRSFLGRFHGRCRNSSSCCRLTRRKSNVISGR